MAKSIYWFAIAALLFCAACNDSTIVGSDILPPEDGFDLVQTDTLTLQSSTRVGDTVRVYDPDFRLQLGNYLCGQLEDPIFGTSRSQIFSQFRLSAVSPDFVDVQFDSLVLALVWDADNLYGELTEPQSFSVFQITEDMDASATYFSDQIFEVGTEIGRIEDVVTPNLEDSITLGTGDNAIRVGPQMRIPLSDELGESFLAPDNFIFFENDSLMFLDFFKGLNIVADEDNSAMYNFNFEDTDTKMTLYYTKFIEIDSTDEDGNVVTDPSTGDTLRVEVEQDRTFDFIINSLAAKTTQYDHDHTLGTVQPFLDGQASGDSLVFVQSMEGLLGVVDFPFAEQLDNIIVNKAELIVTVADYTNTSETFTFPDQLLILEENDDDELVLIDDVLTEFDGVDFGSFGGVPIETVIDGEFATQYEINITRHFQNIVDGTDAPRIFITTFPREEIASRAVFGGATNSKYGMRLVLTYTKL
ncbi:MAG: DUF4270 family protein [Bacteroidota bacterium]